MSRDSSGRPSGRGPLSLRSSRITSTGDDEPHDHHAGDGRSDHEVAGVSVARLRARVDRLDVRDPAQRHPHQPEKRGAHDRDRRGRPRQQPRASRGAVPHLGGEVGERDDHERQARVVVVLERRPVDARPRDPLGQEADEDQGEGEAAAPERLVGDERHGRDGEPPDDHVAGVVDRGGGVVGEAALVEPDRLEVERPRPPRRAGGVRRGQVVVVLVHLAGQLEQRLAASVTRGPAVDDLMAVDERPRAGTARRTRPAARRSGRAPTRSWTAPARHPGRSQPSGGGSWGRRGRTPGLATAIGPKPLRPATLNAR